MYIQKQRKTKIELEVKINYNILKVSHVSHICMYSRPGCAKTNNKDG